MSALTAEAVFCPPMLLLWFYSGIRRRDEDSGLLTLRFAYSPVNPRPVGSAK
jgi:hypothetical protein